MNGIGRVGNATLMFVPDELLGAVLVVLIASGGFAWMLGARRLALGLIGIAVLTPFLGAAFEALFNDLAKFMPNWMLQAIAWGILGVLALSTFGGLMLLLFGRRSWDEAKARLIADAIKFLLKLAISWPALLLWSLTGLYIYFRT